MEDRIELGNPSLSELIRVLSILKIKYGDVYVSGAYDGDWSTPVQILYDDNHLIIGSIS